MTEPTEPRTTPDSPAPSERRLREAASKVVGMCRAHADFHADTLGAAFAERIADDLERALAESPPCRP